MKATRGQYVPTSRAGILQTDPPRLGGGLTGWELCTPPLGAEGTAARAAPRGSLRNETQAPPLGPGLPAPAQHKRRLCPLENSHMNIHGGFNSNCPQLGATQMPINE